MGLVRVLLPALLAEQAGGQKQFELEAPTVGAALRALPVRDLLFDERGTLRPLVNVYVDGEDVRGQSGVDTELRGGETVRVVAAVAGGGRTIRPIALALIRKDDEILVEEGRDEVKGETFFRLLGGTIEFGEQGAETVRRELREELGAETEVEGLVATLENLFTYEGEASHEIVLVYECRLRDDGLYARDQWEAEEPTGNGSVTHKLAWKRLDSFRGGGEILYPEGLSALFGVP